MKPSKIIILYNFFDTWFYSKVTKNVKVTKKKILRLIQVVHGFVGENEYGADIMLKVKGKHFKN